MSNAAKVGAFLVLALLLAAWFVLRIQNWRLGEGSLVPYVVVLEDARGLREKAPVLMRGIRVGRVSTLRLTQDGVAADINIDPEIELHEGAFADVIPVGLLGEMQLQLRAGDPQKPVLPPGSEIPGGAGPTMETVISSAEEVSRDVTEITGAAREAITGPKGENQLEVVVQNLAALTEELRTFTRAMTGVAGRVERLTGLEEDRLRQGVQDATAAAESVRLAAEDLRSLVSDVRQGQGAVGKLIADPQTGEQVEETLLAVRDTARSLEEAVGNIGTFNPGSFSLGFRAEYLTAPSDGIGYVTLEYRPTKMNFLRLEGIGQNDGFTGSAMVGQRIDPVIVRLGILRASPGFGADLMLVKDRLRLTAEAWDFGRTSDLPHARLEAAVFPWKSVFLHGGWDDLLNLGDDQDSLFIGAGFVFGGDERSPQKER